MDGIATGFRIDDTLVPWGTTMAAAADLVEAEAIGDAGVGYSTLRVICRRVYGFDTLAAEMTGYGNSRPVTALAYELCPPQGAAVEPDYWAAPITHALGAATQQSVEDVSGRGDPSGSVRYYASWNGGDVSVGLSIYGALRQIPEGRSAGTLWLSWSLERAAVPYLAAWRTATASLAVAVRGAGPLSIFTLGLEQFAQHGDGGDPGEARQRREAELALTSPDLLATPPAIAQQLSKRSFALWSNPGMKVHCLSTRWDSVIWDAGSSLTVERWETLPAKGPGESALHVGDWRVRDRSESRVIADAAEALLRIPGVSINRSGGYDC
jgi:hypothetical protein